MTEQFASVRIDTLELAIETVIHDARIPKTLRTALEVYQGQQAELNMPEMAIMRCGQTGAPARRRLPVRARQRPIPVGHKTLPTRTTFL
jgi:hypothetical protein